MRATDGFLLAACALLLLSGPLMALQELAAAEEAASLAELMKTTPTLQPAFRAPWRTATFLMVLVAGVAGTLVALRVARKPLVRSLTGRLLGLLLAGMSIADLAFYADVKLFAEAPHVFRAATIVWAYPVAAVLMGGALVRLVEVERAFAGRDREPLPAA